MICKWEAVQPLTQFSQPAKQLSSKHLERNEVPRNNLKMCCKSITQILCRSKSWDFRPLPPYLKQHIGTLFIYQVFCTSPNLFWAALSTMLNSGYRQLVGSGFHNQSESADLLIMKARCGQGPPGMSLRWAGDGYLWNNHQEKLPVKYFCFHKSLVSTGNVSILYCPTKLYCGQALAPHFPASYLTKWNTVPAISHLICSQYFTETIKCHVRALNWVS